MGENYVLGSVSTMRACLVHKKPGRVWVMILPPTTSGKLAMHSDVGLYFDPEATGIWDG